MTPEEFSKKYFTPPVAARYLINMQQEHKRKSWSKTSPWLLPKKQYSIRLGDFIGMAFPWEEAPEGRDYWVHCVWNKTMAKYGDIHIK